MASSCFCFDLSSAPSLMPLFTSSKLKGMSLISYCIPSPILAPNAYDSESNFDRLPIFNVLLPPQEQSNTAPASAATDNSFFICVSKFL